MSSLPVPPSNLWASYGTSVEEYLESGRENVEKMLQIIKQSGTPLATAGRILELGCAAGRMIRWLADLAPVCKIWGIDISSSAILWCKEQLSPPFHFVTTTVSPHLPFEDHYFDCIYAGSIFTHIDDLVDTWFLELRRVLRPGGRLYFTVNDQTSVAIFDGQRTQEESERYYKRTRGKENWDWFIETISMNAGYQRFKCKEAMMVTINRSVDSHVLWDVKFLCKRQEPFYRVLSITEKAYGHQTGVFLERV